MSECENCLHKKVCAKYVATGGYVKECEDLMDGYTATYDVGTTMNITIQKTVEEAIEEIKNKLFVGAPLSEDTMLLALAALMKYANEKE